MISPNSLCKGKTEKSPVNKKPGSTSHESLQRARGARAHEGADKNRPEKKRLQTENRSE